MADCMAFPEKIEDYINFYKFTDTKQYYTNGSELIQVLRVQQMLEHYMPKQGQWLNIDGDPIKPNEENYLFVCSECKNDLAFDEPVKIAWFASNYCPICGAKMGGE